MPHPYHPLVFALALALVRSAGGVVPSQRRSTAVHNNPLAPADAQFAEVQRGGAARRERAFHLHAMQQRFRRANAEVVAAMESDASAGRRARVTDSLRGAVRAALLMRREESDDALAAGGAVQDDGSLSERGGVGSSSGGEVDASASSLGYADSSSGGAAALAASLPASKFGAAASKEPGGSTDPSLCPPGKRRSALVALLLSLFVGWGSEYLYYGYMWHGLARAVVEAAFLATVRVVSRVRPAATCGVGNHILSLPCLLTPHLPPSPSLSPPPARTPQLMYFAIVMVLKNVVKLWERGMPICEDLAVSFSCAACWLLAILVMAWNVYLWIAIPTFAFVPIDGCRPSDLATGYQPLTGDVLI